MIFLATSILLLASFSSALDSCPCAWNSADIFKLIPPSTTCSACGPGCGCGIPFSPDCIGASPACASLFKFMEISSSKMITTMSLQNVCRESAMLVDYVEDVIRNSCGSPDVQPALNKLTQYAQAHGIHIRNVVNGFFNAKAACARPIVRLHEAIVETISQLASVGRKVEYNVKSSSGCGHCCDTYGVLVQTAKAYIDLLTAVMDQTKNHIFAKPQHYANDPVIQSADNIGIVVRQMAQATGKFFATPSRCHDDSYMKSIQNLAVQLKEIEKLTEGLQSASDETLQNYLATIEHKLIIQTYSIKLATFEQHVGQQNMETFQSVYIHDIEAAFTSKDQHFQALQTVVSGLSNADHLKKLLTELIMDDVQVIQQTTVVIDKYGDKQKLAQDIQTLTEVAVYVAKDKIKSDTALETIETYITMATAVEEYAIRLLDLTLRYFVDNLDIVTGFQDLKELLLALKKNTGHDVFHVKDVLEFAKTLKVMLDYPATCAVPMPPTYFRLMQAMSGAAEKYHEKMSHAASALKADDAAKMMTESTAALRSIMLQSWRILLKFPHGTCVQRLNFIPREVQNIFDEFTQLFLNAAATSHELRISKGLIKAEKEFLTLLAGGLPNINQYDLAQIEGLRQHFMKFLGNRVQLKADTKTKLDNMLTKLSRNTMNGCAQVFADLVHAMRDFTLA